MADRRDARDAPQSEEGGFVMRPLLHWYDRVLQPRETSDGSVPDANDTRTVVSIGLNFD